MKILYPGDVLRGKNAGYMFIDVLIALLIIQICLAAAIGALVTHSKYLLKLSASNRETIEIRNELDSTLQTIFTQEK